MPSRRRTFLLPLLVLAGVLLWSRLRFCFRADSTNAPLDLRGPQATPSTHPAAPVAAELPEGEYRVVRVVDGDTLILLLPDSNGQGSQARVRLLAIDCPESVKPNAPVEPFGREASRFTRDAVSGRWISTRNGPHKVDRFGRYLVFVYVDGRLLNAELVEAGLARATVHRGDHSPLTAEIEQAQRRAQAARRGIWSGN